MDEHRNDAAAELFAAPETQTKDWHKPVVTVIPANSAENGPGGVPDFGIDYS